LERLITRSDQGLELAPRNRSLLCRPLPALVRRAPRTCQEVTHWGLLAGIFHAPQLVGLGEHRDAVHDGRELERTGAFLEAGGDQLIVEGL
ncbi:hypothetical protein NL366_27455, partial [Klebsiella pneumoniae]|nr:hypothetical protein [Klebsiella pneumoniae]